MSDPILPPDDELVSAHLDGEATPAESARVLGDPAWAARARELAAVQELTAAPVVPPSAARRDASIAAALDLFDQLVPASAGADGATADPVDAHGPPAAAPAPVATAAAPAPVPSVADDELAARRARAASDARRAGRNGRILAVAAVVVVALLGLGVVIRAQTARTSDTALSSAAGRPSTTAARSPNEVATKSQNDSSSQSEQPTAAAGSDAPSTTAPATPTTTVAPVTTTVRPAPAVPGDQQTRAAAAQYRFQSQSLGTFTTPAQVRTSVITTLAADAGASTTTPAAGAESAASADALAAVSRCDATIRATDGEVGPIVLSAPATYNRTPALVLVYSIDRTAHPAANGGSRIYTVDAGSCAVLDVQTG